MLTRACCAALVVVAPLAAASLGVQSPYNGGEVNNVAIIGAGAAGASTAYHLSQYARGEGIPINITVFEKTEHVGGRTLTVNAYDDPNEPVELGASIFVSANRIIHDAAIDFGLELQDPMPHNKGDLTIIWDSEKVVYATMDGSAWWWDAAKMWWRYGMSPYRALGLVKTVVQTFLKLYEPPYFPFRSLTQRAYELGLERVTGVTGEQFLADHKIDTEFSRHILQSATRVNYASNLNHIHGLETMVSFATDGAVSVKGGNWQIFDKMMEHSGAQLCRNTTVEAINFKPRAHSTRPSIQYAISTSGGTEQTAFDNIVIATPWQFSNISAGPGIISHRIDEIPYRKLYVTLFTSPYMLRTDMYGLERGSKPPSNVYTTLRRGDEGRIDNPAGATEFLSLSTLRTVMNPVTQRREFLYKMFAPKTFPLHWLDEFFDADASGKVAPNGQGHDEEIGGVDGEDDKRQPQKVSWYYRRAFDAYPIELPRVTFQDSVVGNGIYYTSGMESFISTMETSALMGKNVARLIADDFAGMPSGGAAGGGAAYFQGRPASAASTPPKRQREDFFESLENDLDEMFFIGEL